MEREYTYDAFISYRHLEFDKTVADELQKLLEDYEPPSTTVLKSGGEKLHLFRDETELAASSNLSDEIKRALESSFFLIVICSKATKESHWCRQEIEYFKELHNGSVSNIITVVIEGEPTEVFLEELRFETHTYVAESGNIQREMKEVEPFAPSISSPTMGEALEKLKKEELYLRIIAKLIGRRYDELYDRAQRRREEQERKRKERKRKNIFILSIALAMLGLGFGVYSSYRRAETDRYFQEAKSLLLSAAIDYAERLNEQGARARAGAVLQSVYVNINDDWENADDLRLRFRDVAVDTLFYRDERLPFARQDLSGEIMQINAAEEQGFAVITTGNYLYKISLENGDILNIFSAPKGDQFLIANVYDRYILAVTEAKYIIQIDTKFEGGKLLVSKEPIVYYAGEDIIKINFNKSISALTVVHYVEGRYHRNSQDVNSSTYIPAGEEELFSKIILTIVPWDFNASEIELDLAQVFTYRADPTFVWSPMPGISWSENGGFLAIKNQQYYVATRGLTVGEIRGTHIYVNSDVIVIDIGKFDAARDISVNEESMTQTIDVRFSREELFVIDEFFINNQGLLIIYGRKSDEGGEGKQESRTIVYNIKDGAIVFNKQIRLETDEQQGDRVFSERHCEYCDTERFVTAPGEMEQYRGYIIPTACNERWLLYQIERGEESLLKVYDLLFNDGTAYVKYQIPRNFNVTYALIDDTRSCPCVGSLCIVLIGAVQGSSRVLLLHRGVWEESVQEVQTIDVMASSGVMVKPGQFMIGHLDGTLLMYSFGDHKELASDAYRILGSDHMVFRGDEITEITLQQVTDAYSITPISFDEERALVFGYERFFDKKKDHFCSIYSIWDLQTGEVVKTFNLYDLGIEKDIYQQHQMKINSDFTYTMVRMETISTIKIYVVEVATGEIRHSYEYKLPDLQVAIWDNVLLGMGTQSNEIWVFHASSLLLERIDISRGERISARYITERMSEEVDAPIGWHYWWWYDDIFYFDSDEMIVFTGINPYVYSFHSSRKIFADEIRRVCSDGTAIYVGASLIRIPLTHEGLFEALNQSPFIGSMTEEDRRVTGLDIFN